MSGVERVSRVNIVTRHGPPVEMAVTREHRDKRGPDQPSATNNDDFIRTSTCARKF